MLEKATAVKWDLFFKPLVENTGGVRWCLLKPVASLLQATAVRRCLVKSMLEMALMLECSLFSMLM